MVAYQYTSLLKFRLRNPTGDWLKWGVQALESSFLLCKSRMNRGIGPGGDDDDNDYGIARYRYTFFQIASPSSHDNREFKIWRRQRQRQHHKSIIWLVEWKKIIVLHVHYAFGAMFWRSLPNDNVKFSYLRFWRQRELAEVNLSFFAFTWKTFVPSKWKCTPPILYNVTTLFDDWHETDNDDEWNELSQFCFLCVTIMFAFSFVLFSAFAYAIRSAA